MEREAFRQRMQQYKQARENNPQLKYWDWKSTVQREPLDGVYEDARFIDQSEPRFELRKGQQYYASPNNLKLMKVLGKTVKVLAPIGEVVQNLFPSEEAEILEDARYKYENALKPKVYADGGEVKDNTYVAPIYKEQTFIPATGAQKIKNDYQYKYGSKSPYKGGELEIISPEFDILTGITPDISKLQKQSDWNDLRNRSIERLYDPEVRARAAKIKSDYNVDLQSTYDKIINQYENDYFSLPEAEIMQLQDAKAMIDLQEEAARRYKQYGIKPTQKDFRIKIDNAVTPSQEITNHEINHFNQYIHQDNPSWNKSELDKITKQFKGKLRDKNPIDPENTSYFMNWMEQNVYGINMLDRLKELNIKPTKQNILKYLKSLPDTDSIKKAALQFKNLDDYIKWLNTMPLADNGNINEIENYNFA